MQALAGAVAAMNQVVAQLARRANPDLGLVERLQVCEMAIDGGVFFASVSKDCHVEAQPASGSRANRTVSSHFHVKTASAHRFPGFCAVAVATGSLERMVQPSRLEHYWPVVA